MGSQKQALDQAAEALPLKYAELEFLTGRLPFDGFRDLPVIDVGSHHGDFTKYFLEQGFRVLSFEPSPDNLMRQTARLQSFLDTGRLSLFPIAASNRDGFATLMLGSADALNTLEPDWTTKGFPEYFQATRTMIVQTRKLAAFLAERGVSDAFILKVDTEGHDLAVLQGLFAENEASLRPRVIMFEAFKPFEAKAFETIRLLQELGYGEFHWFVKYGQDLLFHAAYPDDRKDVRLDGYDLYYANIIAFRDDLVVPDDTDLDRLRSTGLWQDGSPLRLHLGCGQQRLAGYVNIDYPPSEHSVMTPAADYHQDILALEFPPNSVDEIRLHHVFEHFPRVTALGLLIKWHGWLKLGGKLHIETPDMLGSAQTMVSPEHTFRTRMGVVRHLAGDQADAWAYHVDHWFPERFQVTLPQLGFGPVEVKTSAWPHEPYLSNVEAWAHKDQNVRLEHQLLAADELLWDSTVSPVEMPTHEVWREQLRRFLVGGHSPVRSNPAAATFKAVTALPDTSSQRSLDEIHDFNQRARDRWVEQQAALTPPGSNVLDVGAGTCPYRHLFAHCDYQAHDFKQYEGVKLGGTHDYGAIDHVSDITELPLADESFDVVLCTEVLEHVAEPIKAVQEMARILRPGGRLLLTAPLGSGLHQLPYHYYGGFTPEWYRHFFAESGLQVVDIAPNGGFFKLLAQECARVAWMLPKHQHLHGDHVEAVRQVFAEVLPRFLYELDEECPIDQFTVGYHVVGLKR